MLQHYIKKNDLVIVSDYGHGLISKKVQIIFVDILNFWPLTLKLTLQI